MDFTLTTTTQAIVDAGQAFFDDNVGNMFGLLIAFFGIMLIPMAGKSLLWRLWGGVRGIFGR